MTGATGAKTGLFQRGSSIGEAINITPSFSSDWELEARSGSSALQQIIEQHRETVRANGIDKLTLALQGFSESMVLFIFGRVIVDMNHVWARGVTIHPELSCVLWTATTPKLVLRALFWLMFKVSPKTTHTHTHTRTQPHTHARTHIYVFFSLFTAAARNMSCKSSACLLA